MVKVYKRKNFSIYSGREGFIVHNTHKEFSKGHTHINNYHTAKYLIAMSLKKEVPYHASSYIYGSLIRLAEDQSYIQRITKKMEGDH